MKKIVQINWATRAQGHVGGVPKFAWYLQKAVGGESYGSGENPYSNYDGILPIVDGSLCDGMPDIPIISVVHGTWAGFADVNNHPPFTNGQIHLQNKVWQRPNVIKVAVSPWAGRDLQKWHKVTPHEVILNCVDTDLYCPRPRAPSLKPVVIYCANDANKGCALISRLADKMPDFSFQYLNARPGEEHLRFNTGDIYLHPSNYEGNSFAVLEAMASGLPVVGTRTGMLADIPNGQVGITLEHTDPDEKFIEAIKQVNHDRGYYHPPKYRPREWVLENATFEIFRDKWKALVNKYL